MAVNKLKKSECLHIYGNNQHFPDKIQSLPQHDGDFDARKLVAAGCDVLFASYPAGKHVPPHSHETDNHGVIVRGQLNMIIDGRHSSYKAGDWYHVPAGDIHEVSVSEATDTIEFWFLQ